MGLLLYATGRQPLHVVPGVHHPQGTRTPGRPAPRTVEKFCHWQKRKLRAPRREVRAGKNRGTCIPLPPAPWPETAFLGGGRHSCHRLHGGVRRVLEGCDLSLLVLMFLRVLCVMGREEHQRELAAFLAFDIEAVSQVAYLLILILYARCRGTNCIRSAAASHCRRNAWFSDDPSMVVPGTALRAPFSWRREQRPETIRPGRSHSPILLPRCGQFPAFNSSGNGGLVHPGFFGGLSQ